MGLFTKFKSDNKSDKSGKKQTKPFIPSHARTNTSNTSLSYSDFLNNGSDSSCTSSESHNHAIKQQRSPDTTSTPTSNAYNNHRHSYDPRLIQSNQDELPLLDPKLNHKHSKSFGYSPNPDRTDSSMGTFSGPVSTMLDAQDGNTNLTRKPPSANNYDDAETSSFRPWKPSPAQRKSYIQALDQKQQDPFKLSENTSPKALHRSESTPGLSTPDPEPEDVDELKYQNEPRKEIANNRPPNKLYTNFQEPYKCHSRYNSNNKPISQPQSPLSNQFASQVNMSQNGYSAPMSNVLQPSSRRQSADVYGEQADYLADYSKSRNSSRNELISATRKSTIKSNRFSSAPSKSRSIGDLTKRISSLGTKVDQDGSTTENQDVSHVEVEGNKVEKPYNSLSSKGRLSGSLSVPNGLSDISLHRHISDYSKYLFEEEEDDDKDQLPTPTSINGQIERSNSVDSGNSIQSNGSQKFQVTSPQERTQRLQSMQSNLNPMAEKKQRSISPPEPRRMTRVGSQPQLYSHAMSLNNFPGYQRPQSVFFNAPPMEMQVPSNSSPYTNPLMNYSTEYAGSVHDPSSRRQSLTVADTQRMRMRNSVVAPDVLRRSMILPVMPLMPSTLMPQIPKIHDGTINRKIEDFIELRTIISSGNKSLVYRLRWVQMLITAVNYNLYSFINIKGELVPLEQADYNKQLFIKSAITHLFKLLKEDTGKKKYEAIRREVYYTHGCLLKQDYLNTYNETFGFEKNITNAIEMFEKCLEINPSDYKSLYKLGEIFEYEYPEEFDKALQYYKEAAQLSYNRAILKVALLYINVPELRSLRFIKYLTDLANIHIDDVEVKTDEELEEVGDVIGLAAYELGKIYEGIYPGDLSFEDEFIQKSLEIAPVNYAKSLTYYNKSAKMNCLLGLVKLGNVYEFGELNRQRNANKSIQWYMKATTSPLWHKRHPDAMLGLSRWNLNGSGGFSKQIPFPNPPVAVMWCERAIREFESVDAMYFMGELSEMGLTTSDPNTWFSKAYSLGHESAGRKLGLQPEYNGEGYEQEDYDDEPELSGEEEAEFFETSGDVGFEEDSKLQI
jgi:TPR repeat protein